MKTLETRTLPKGYTVPRIIKGGWQLAGGHGSIDRARAIADMNAFAEAGITTFDCADIYTGVEEMIGEFLREWRTTHGEEAPVVRVHTKCVPDRDALATLTRADVERLIDRSRTRLGVEALDLVQLHWWDYDVPGAIEAALHLAALRDAGKIQHIGLTNFGNAHVRAIVDAGVPVTSHQVQCSLLDRRALGDMATLCAQHGIALLTYGALAGGFFHERWLGAPDPTAPLENRSLTKYRLIIEEFGGWSAFQRLLETLDVISRSHKCTIGTIAIRAVLDEAVVSAAIVGARHAGHLAATVQALQITLSNDERAALHAHVHSAPGPHGDVYALEREKGGRHASIMKYNLNTRSSGTDR